MSLPKNADADKTNFDDKPSRSDVQCCCSLLTSAGASATAVLAVWGRDSRAVVAACFTPATQSPLLPAQVRYGTWSSPQRDRAQHAPSANESVVILPVQNDHWEVHCHGGAAASNRIIEDLRGLGAELTDPGQLQRYVDKPLAIREAEEILVGCQTAKMASIAMDQVRGALERWCRDAASKLQRGDETHDAVREGAGDLLRWADLGLSLTCRFRVVLLGAPNVGKSSLVNAILGYDRSITMDLPGTTRDVLHADTSAGGVPIRLSDTAGLRETTEQIELEGVSRARGAADMGNLLILVSAPDTPPIEAPPGKDCLHVFNKADLAVAGQRPPDSSIATVATTGEGVAELLQRIADSLVQFPEPGTPLPVTSRQVGCLWQIAKSESVEWTLRMLKILATG